MRTFLVLMVHDEGLQHEEVIKGVTFREAIREGIVRDDTLLGCKEDMTDKMLGIEEYLDEQIEWVKHSEVNGDSDCQVIVYDVTDGVPVKLYPN